MYHRLRFLPVLVGFLLILIGAFGLYYTASTANRAGSLTVYAQDDGLAIEGQISDKAGQPLAGIFVGAMHTESEITTTVVSSEDGRYVIPNLPTGTYRVAAHQIGFEATDRVTSELTDSVVTVDLALEAAEDVLSQLPNSTWMSLLPAGPELRKFIIDCSGCHQLAYVFDRNRGWPSLSHWERSIGQMMRNYGPGTGFPIIGPRDAEETAGWLAETLSEDVALPELAAPLPILGEATNIIYTEYEYPREDPHDLALLADGKLAITGMDSDSMWVLDPATGSYARHRLPSGANPRAIEVAEDGTWWIVFGWPQQVARFDPATEALTIVDIGMYAHSVGIDAADRVWANGHFTTDPVRIVSVDPATLEVTEYGVPTDEPEQTGLPIAYDLRVDAEGRVWSSDLNWNRIYKLDPASGEVSIYRLPNPDSAPRRFDFDAAGNVWIPEFAGNRLTKFDPMTETFTTYDIPTANVQPYVAKVDDTRGVVWVAYAGGDAVARFDIASETFVEYRLPTNRALIRHMVIDEASGAVWVSYHHVPGIGNGRIVRLDVPE